MRFFTGQAYHIYNRGNNKDKIFFSRNNYLYFLQKIKYNLLIHFDILAYCLMPNHFHLLVLSKDEIDQKKSINSFSTMLSSYSQAINKQENRSGSIFQKKTKSKLLFSKANDFSNLEYLYICFNYIHQNPLKAGLVNKLEDWEFSSFKDYAGLRNGTLCNKSYCKDLFGIHGEIDFYEKSYKELDLDKLKNIF
jgi:putative transposase